ncbi:UTP--glucose-1-phosphate uridylyltransferase, partial [Corallococcus exercitus]|nr:UTP--glucose-1-phosphate uridylyltransferase [Corallococcus exercitus]
MKTQTPDVDGELDDPRLARDGFDAASFRALLARYQRGELTESQSLAGPLEPPRPGDVQPLPGEGTAAHGACRAAGEQAFREGAVAALVVA